MSDRQLIGVGQSLSLRQRIHARELFVHAVSQMMRRVLTEDERLFAQAAYENDFGVQEVADELLAKRKK